jgi:hypothetical protein
MGVFGEAEEQFFMEMGGFEDARPPRRSAGSPPPVEAEAGDGGDGADGAGTVGGGSAAAAAGSAARKLRKKLQQIHALEGCRAPPLRGLQAQRPSGGACLQSHRKSSCISVCRRC